MSSPRKSTSPRKQVAKGFSVQNSFSASKPAAHGSRAQGSSTRPTTQENYTSPLVLDTSQADGSLEAVDPGQNAGDDGKGKKKEERAPSNSIKPNERMTQFIDLYAQRAQNALLRREIGPNDGPCPDCRKGSSRPAQYRCVDCLHRRPLCSECLLKGHQWQPFHRVEKWAGFWQRTTLSQLGLILNLGHGGRPCKVQKQRGNLREMTIVHGRGIERIKVKFCLCVQGEARTPANDFDQLMDCDLFPASWVRPTTAFTMAVMKDLQLLALQAQAPAGDLMKFLARSSDNVDPDDVDDRYREYMISQREFTYLSATKRAGVQPDRNMSPGSLAVLCPACPQIGINMDPQWKTRGDDLRFLDALYYATDGNFHLNQKIKPMDKADFPLTMGAAYFAHEEDYSKFLGRVPPSKEPEKTSCHEFAALGYGGYTGKVSGVVGCYCQRHMFALPGGLVDLQKGERFANVDYVMLSALQPYMDLHTHVSGYDINCQYRINLMERLEWMRKNTKDLASILKYDFPKTLAAVGKFHLPAHCEWCRIFFSFHFLPWCAMTDGEAAERLWAILNGIGNATREMTPGNRHDFINALLGDLNARRVHGIAKYMARKHDEAKEALIWAKEELDEAEQEAGGELVAGWRAELQTWLLDVVDIKNHKQMSNPFEPEKSAAMTKTEALAVHVEGEDKDVSAVGLAKAISEGVDLDARRINLIRRLTTAHMVGDPTVAEDYKKYMADSGAWKQRHDMYILPLVVAVTAGKPELHLNAFMQDDSHASGEDEEDEEGAASGKRKRGEEGDDASDVLKKDTARKGARSGRSRKELTNPEMLLNLRERRIRLPSSYSVKVQKHPLMEAATEIERSLREGQANDALDKLRAQLISSYSFYLYKKGSTHTQGVETRTKSMARRKDDAIARESTTYRRARQALVALGMADKAEEGKDEKYPSLTKADVKPFTVYTADAKLGDSKRRTSWIWSKFEKLLTSKNKSLKTWSTSALKALWCRRESLYKRWWEETLLINEEMQRVRRTFIHFQAHWLGIAETCNDNDPGRAAYARRQAFRYERLLEGADHAFEGKITSPVYKLT